jgi:hypothetical protein
MFLKKVKVLIKNFSYLKIGFLKELNRLYAEEYLGKELAKKKHLIDENYKTNPELHEKYGKIIKFEDVTTR